MPIIYQKIFDNPALVESAYRQGHILGAITPDNPQRDLAKAAQYEIDKFMDEDPLWRFEDAADDDIYGDYEGKLCLPWHHAKKLDVMTGTERQRTGDCVSVSSRTAGDITRCCEIAAGEPESYKKRGASALIYSGRGWSGQGMNSASAHRHFVKEGLLVETVYRGDGGEKMDFTNYDEYYKIGMKLWNNRFPEWIKEQTRPFGPKKLGSIRNGSSLLTALWNGYGVSGGSMMGVSKQGGYKGVPWLSRPSGSWAHEMSPIGFDDRRIYLDETIVFWDQTWGIWNHIKESMWPKELQPVTQGMFALTLTDSVNAAIRPGTFHAFSNTNGFKAQRLKEFGVPEGLFGQAI